MVLPAPIGMLFGGAVNMKLEAGVMLIVKVALRVTVVEEVKRVVKVVLPVVAVARAVTVKKQLLRETVILVLSTPEGFPQVIVFEPSEA